MTDPETLNLAADFAPASAAAWRKLVDAVLKGAPFERLRSKTYDGLAIEPLAQRAATAAPVIGRTPGTPWTIMQRVDHPDPAAANAQLHEDLQNGATGLVLVFAGSLNANGFGIEASAAALARVLEGIDLTAGIAIDLNLAPATRQVVRELADLIRSRGVPPATVDLRTSFNPVGAFAAAGVSPGSWDAMAPNFAAVIGRFAAAGFRGPFVVADSRVIHNAGGSEAQELAFVLASAVTYLRALEPAMGLGAARDAIYFRLAADAEQFLTMAKFRAARKLWARVQQACGLTPKPVMISAETAWRMLTKRDPYVNMLRTTIAVAAGALGGADNIVVLPHTAALGLPDAFARRVARNTQLVLLEESNLFRVADPAAGSGSLEALTQELCAAAWTMFQDIEKAGGVWPALQTGLVQQRVADVRAARERTIARRSDILTGTNEFPDLQEATATVLDVAPVPAPREEPAGTAIAALPRIRLAEPFERLREASDQILARTGARPKVFLAALGKLPDSNARANFAKNFFEAGGIEAVGGDEILLAALAADFKASGAALACLCASDKMYESDGAAAAAALRQAGAQHIYLAGRPGSGEADYREAGVGTFIYSGCDALAILEVAHDLISHAGYAN